MASSHRTGLGEGAGTVVSGTEGTLLSLAPAATDLPRLLRIAIDAAQVGAARIHLAPDQPQAADAVAAIREQTALIVTTDPGGTAEPYTDLPGPAFAELLLPARLPAPEMLTELARLAGQHPNGASVGAAGAPGLPVLLGTLAAGLHVRVGTADQIAGTQGAGDLHDPVRTAGHGGPLDDIALIARAAGLARIAGRPALPIARARAMLGLDGAEPAE